MSEDKWKKIINEEEFKKFILEKLSENELSKKSLIIDDEYLQNLKQNYQLLVENINFAKGDLVKWKRGLKNRRFPEYNQPVIVIDILDNPFLSEKEEIGSPNFREPLDLLLGIQNSDSFLIFHYDKRRFEKYIKWKYCT